MSSVLSSKWRAAALALLGAAFLLATVTSLVFVVRQIQFRRDVVRAQAESDAARKLRRFHSTWVLYEDLDAGTASACSYLHFDKYVAIADMARPAESWSSSGTSVAPPVRSVVIGDSKFGDSDVYTLLPFTFVRCVDLEGTGITDAGLTELSALPRLAKLNVASTSVTDEGLRILGQLDTLERLVLERTSITDSGITHLHGLDRLESVDLTETTIGARGIELLGELPRLKHLRLGGTNINDQVAEALGRLSNLEVLEVFGSAITDKGMYHIVHLERLRRVDLIYTPGVTDESVDALGNLHSLENLTLVGTGMTRRGVSRIETLLPGCKVSAAIMRSSQ